MFALRVRINDDEPVTAGAEDLALLSAHIMGMGKLGSKPQFGMMGEAPQFNCTVAGMTMGGLGSPQDQLRWMPMRKLNVGDKITIEIIETEFADPVVSSEAAKTNERPSLFGDGALDASEN
ncbi:MAG TPA: hypothetical protein VGE52_17935 [Pirellulales bacterium]